MIKKLNEVNVNIIAIVIVEIITCSISFSANYSGASGIETVIIKWIPALIGLVTLFLYFLSRLFTKKLNWLISLIGIVLMLFAALNIYTTDFSLNVAFL